MLKERNIAFFIDLYNTELSAQHFNNIVCQLEDMGQIISGTIYGATERTHKDVLDQADARGYYVVRGARKRGRKAFDNRIIVDVVDKINHSRGIDTVCIVALPADMVYLYAYLRERGIKIVSLNNCDENTMALVDETVDTGKVETIKLPKAPAKPKTAPVVEPVVEEPVVVEPVAPVSEPVIVEPTSEPVVEVAVKPVVEPVAPAIEPAPAPAEEPVSVEFSRMDQLLKEIDRLRAEVEKSGQPQIEVPVAPVVEPAPAPAEEPVAPAPVEEPVEVPVEEHVQAPADEPVEAPVEQPVEAPAEPVAPRAAYTPQDDADIFRKIEEMRKTAGSDGELIDEIKKLLDSLE